MGDNTSKKIQAMTTKKFNDLIGNIEREGMPPILNSNMWIERKLKKQVEAGDDPIIIDDHAYSNQYVKYVILRETI